MLYHFIIYCCYYLSVLFLTKMPVKGTTTCPKCTKIVARSQFPRHMKSHESGRLFCPKCSHFSCTTQQDLDFHITKKHSDDTLDDRLTCTTCKESFPSYYSLNQHKRLVHGTKSKLDNYQDRKSTR